MAPLSRVGLFCFRLPEHLMPLIDIVTMRGMIPRVAGQLLPDEAAELAQDCAFDRGIITPLRDDLGLGVQLPFTPKTIFHYYGEFWFAWSGLVEVMRSPIAQDQYNRVYFTDGAYPKLTYDAIATGGRQTIIRDSAGNANAMFVLPRFTYADIGMTTDMGAGDITAFDFGSGSIKGEIFIGAYLASGSGAVSAPRQDPRTSLDHTAARDACSAKGAGWHLMTAHEWAAIALWCMANGYEPIGNTNWGRSHAKTWMVGDRSDNRSPGDTAGTGRTQTGSMGSEATHTRTLGGIADLVGNVWEWQDGLLLQDGRFKISAYNTQAEVDWAFVDAFLDASTPTGGSAILSNAVNNRLGAIGDNANAGNSANVEWRAMTKSGSYVSNQAMKRLLLEPAGALPQGRIYMRNYGERLPFRGGSWSYGSNAGLAALALDDSRVSTYTSLGFRPAFA